MRQATRRENLRLTCNMSVCVSRVLSGGLEDEGASITLLPAPLEALPGWLRVDSCPRRESIFPWVF